MKYKYATLFIMGNKYGIMVKVALTCRVSKDIEKNSKAFTVVVHTTDGVDVLKKKIYEEVKKTNNDFLDIVADILWLWKVEIKKGSDEEFLNLVLENDNTKNITMLQGEIGDYWDNDEKPPREECIHVIVDSPILSKMETLKRTLASKNEELAEIMAQLEL